MGRYVIVGAGVVGRTTAGRLADAGHRVVLVSRSGTGTGAGRADVEPVAADATDAAGLTALADGADALFNCANPAYHRWPTDWPPIADALLQAAERSGAVLVTMSNLYGYGPMDRPVREDDPLASAGTKGRVRAQMWHQARAAHEAGRIRATEARASDFWGPGVTGAHLAERVVPKVLAGKRVSVLGDPDAPHSWSYIDDVAATLAALATDERAWGRPWHVPSGPARSAREMVGLLAAAAGRPAPKVGAVPSWALTAAGVVSPLMREMREVAHQFDRPFVLDASRTEAALGLAPTPVVEAAATTVAWWRERSLAGGGTAQAA
jgi:nucleoside-diphosphate-sugar epimerase